MKHCITFDLTLEPQTIALDRLAPPLSTCFTEQPYFVFISLPYCFSRQESKTLLSGSRQQGGFCTPSKRHTPEIYQPIFFPRCSQTLSCTYRCTIESRQMLNERVGLKSYFICLDLNLFYNINWGTNYTPVKKRGPFILFMIIILF